MGSDYDTYASHVLVASLQQRILRLEAALKGLDNNDIRAFNRLGGLEDRIEKLEAYIATLESHSEGDALTLEDYSDAVRI